MELTPQEGISALTAHIDHFLTHLAIAEAVGTIFQDCEIEVTRYRLEHAEQLTVTIKRPLVLTSVVRIPNFFLHNTDGEGALRIEVSAIAECIHNLQR